MSLFITESISSFYSYHYDYHCHQQEQTIGKRLFLKTYSMICQLMLPILTTSSPGQHANNNTNIYRFLLLFFSFSPMRVDNFRRTFSVLLSPSVAKGALDKRNICGSRRSEYLFFSCFSFFTYSRIC
jgi:hypothetical protein